MAALPFKPEVPGKALTLSEPLFPQLFLRGQDMKLNENVMLHRIVTGL